MIKKYYKLETNKLTVRNPLLGDVYVVSEYKEERNYIEVEYRENVYNEIYRKLSPYLLKVEGFIRGYVIFSSHNMDMPLSLNSFLGETINGIDLETIKEEVFTLLQSEINNFTMNIDFESNDSSKIKRLEKVALRNYSAEFLEKNITEKDIEFSIDDKDIIPHALNVLSDAINVESKSMFVKEIAEFFEKEDDEDNRKIKLDFINNVITNLFKNDDYKKSIIEMLLDDKVIVLVRQRIEKRENAEITKIPREEINKILIEENSFIWTW